jgi:uncharacterized protein (TIGR03437 family)
MLSTIIQMTMRTVKLALFFCLAQALPLAAQAPTSDNSGNGMLKGNYYFRHVLYVISSTADSQGIVGDISDGIAVYGVIAFDGSGNYTINGMVADSSVGTPDPLSCYLAQNVCAATAGSPVMGTYAISASGFGFLANPLSTGDSIYGLVSANGIFAGSTTETTSNYCDLFIAAPQPSTQPTFSGVYTVAGYEAIYAGADYLPGQDMFFQMNPNGAGNLGTVNVTGYYEGGGTGTISQSNSNIKYRFSNNAAVVTFPNNTNANFFAGDEYLYFSPDGNFIFGGSPNGYDMIVGLRNASGTQNFGGLYYQAGIDQNVSQLGAGYADFDGYYGALNASANGIIIAHERLNDQILQGSTYAWTFLDSFNPPVTGSYTDNSYQFQYVAGDGGTIRIGQGIGPYLGLSVAFQAPGFPATQSVFISPGGIVNAASNAPFTGGISNGEFISIYGTNLASRTALASTLPLPTTLAGVQVMINGTIPAPIDYVSPGQLNVIVPSQYPYSLAQVQVINNGVSSNVVTVPVNPSGPGIYANPSGGVYAAAIDAASGMPVTPATPAQPGDTLEVFATGLGVVSPPVPDGSAPPSSPLSYTYNTITADIDGTNAPVSFAGLAPGLAGLYQINVQIPSTTPAGDHFLDLSASDPKSMALQSYSQQVLISVAGSTAALRGGKAMASPRTSSPRNVSPYLNRKRFCAFDARSACQN